MPRISHCDPIGYGVGAGLIIGLAATIGALFFITRAIANPQIAVENNENKKIHIQADKVIADIDTGETEFLGHVKMSQGKMIVTAERMKIYYNRGLLDQKQDAPIKESIKKIVATGQVKINFDNLVALTEEAVYAADTGVLILSGNDSQLISGANSIAGPRFTFHRSTENIIVEGSRQNQIKAVFYAADKSFF